MEENELIQKQVAKGHSDRGFMNDSGKAVLGEATQLDVSVAGKALFFLLGVDAGVSSEQTSLIFSNR